MNRRNILTTLGAAGTGLLAGRGPLAVAQQVARRGMPPLKITDVKVILTQPADDHLVIVKVLTSEPGLYGVGCATHRERPLAVAAAIEQYLKPFVIGRNCDEIEDIWQSAYVASYFRSGVTLNNALSGIDGALWDILGKRGGVPVYKLLGGKVRTAVPLYAHASARDCRSWKTRCANGMAQGYRYVRVQLAVPGFAGYGVQRRDRPEDIRCGRPGGVAVLAGLRTDALRQQHDQDVRAPARQPRLRRRTASRRPRARAAQPGDPAGKALEPYRLFFMEDPLCAGGRRLVPSSAAADLYALAMGELFVNRNEWVPLVAERLIDFIRHPHLGRGRAEYGAQGRRPAASFSTSAPLGTAPATSRRSAMRSICILTWRPTTSASRSRTCFPIRVREVFPGAPEIKGGYMYANDKPGLGIDIDEKLAAKFPYQHAGRQPRQ